MGLLDVLRGRRRAHEQMIQALKELVAGVGNQSELLNRKFEQLLDAVVAGSSNRKFEQLIEAQVAGVDNQTDLLNQKFAQLIEGQDHQSDLLNRKFEQLIESQADLLDRKLAQLIEGQDHQTDLLNRKFGQLFVSEDNQADLLNRKFDGLLEGLDHQTDLLNRKFEQLFVSEDNQSNLINRRFGQLISALGHEPESIEWRPSAHNFAEATQHMPLMIDDRTFNTNHPDYDAKLVRNYPGKIFNRNGVCTSPVFGELLKQARGDDVADGTWNKILADTLIEAASVPGAAQVFERRNYIENYMAELGRKYHALYVAGWVNLDDALFLYRLVRQTKPRKIVQCGACNGLSSSFMMLALAKNGPEGTLSIIDLPFVFDPKNPEWTREGKAHGVCIPEGKTTAWMVPDIYRDRLEVWNGDAKDLLPKMVDKVDSIDFFFHDSDHTYRHMMFEFAEAKRKLTPGGLIVADDISWNSSLWDFADSYSAPSYNFKGTVGAAFF
jgi:predicted O-methyltransferase YrrM